MKCIQFTHGAVRFGTIARLSDADAEEFVRMGQAVYVSKQTWKQAGREYY